MAAQFGYRVRIDGFVPADMHDLEQHQKIVSALDNMKRLGAGFDALQELMPDASVKVEPVTRRSRG